MTVAARRYRVLWLPGSDELFVQCHCGAQRGAEDPVQAWDWLMAHPAGHGAADPAADPGAPVAHGAAADPRGRPRGRG
jgi:hypothetical protein